MSNPSNSYTNQDFQSLLNDLKQVSSDNTRLVKQLSNMATNMSHLDIYKKCFEENKHDVSKLSLSTDYTTILTKIENLKECVTKMNDELQNPNASTYLTIILGQINENTAQNISYLQRNQ